LTEKGWTTFWAILPKLIWSPWLQGMGAYSPLLISEKSLENDVKLSAKLPC
jgi:hypothetical protein